MQKCSLSHQLTSKTAKMIKVKQHVDILTNALSNITVIIFAVWNNAWSPLIVLLLYSIILTMCMDGQIVTSWRNVV